MAPVCNIREIAYGEAVIITKMTGQRSRAEIYANEVLSEVE